MLVPLCVMGRVIGSKFCNLKAIRAVSGALRIEQEEPHLSHAEEWRLAGLRIEGSVESVRMARYLVAMVVEHPTQFLAGFMPSYREAVNTGDLDSLRRVNRN